MLIGLKKKRQDTTVRGGDARCIEEYGNESPRDIPKDSLKDNKDVNKRL